MANGMIEPQNNQVPTGVPPQAAAPVAAPVPEAPVAPEPSTDQLQEQVDTFAANAIRMINDEKVADRIISRLSMAEDPVNETADTTLDFMGRLEESVSKSTGPPPMPVFISGANVVMGEIINLAEVANVKKFSQEDKVKAFGLVMSKYVSGAVDSGAISKEQLIAMGKDAEQSEAGKEFRANAGDAFGGGMGQPGLAQPTGNPELEGPLNDLKNIEGV